MLDALAAEIHETAKSKGFYDHEYIAHTHRNPSIAPEKLALITSEVAEVLEALRYGDKMSESEELADVLIRVLDYAAWRDISLDEEVAAKMKKNNGRPHLHGRKF